MIRTGPTSGLNSDFVTSSMYIGDSLPEGLRLGEYEILSVIGEGGFGIVYLAYDHFLQRQVALKEYMPSSLAGRSRMGLEVTIKSERHRDTFQAGLKSFINEARLLAQFDHRALVKVYRFWEGNGTAYMVMPYVVGPTLKTALAEMPGPPDEAWLRGQVLTPLIEALSLLHKASCLHRDIAPDNILLTETGPMLLDFGAARKVIGDLNQTLTVVLKPGYAPIEQYGEVPGLTQGPWTDVYALGGVVRYAITGKVPVSATTRLVHDTMAPMAELAASQYGEAFLRAVDAALAVKPGDRPQDMAQFAALLGAEPGVALSVDALPVGAADAAPVAAPGPQPRTLAPTVPAEVTEGATEDVTQPGTRPAAVVPPVVTQAAVAPDPAAVARPARPARSAAPWWAAGVVGLLLVLGAAAWWWSRPAPRVVPVTSEPVPASGTGSSAQPSPLAPAAIEPSSSPTMARPAPLPAPAAEPASTVNATAAPSPAPRVSGQSMPRAVAPVVPSPLPSSPPSVREPVRATPQPTTAPSPGPAAAAGARAARCTDLLQKASLEPLSPSETSFLKTECK